VSFTLDAVQGGLDEDGLNRDSLTPLYQAADMGVLHSCGWSPREHVIHFWEPCSWIAKGV